tara:strand:- start:168 stop:434 length:267 start_codon:yes stop_codon:yes gene_type:complete
MKIEIFSKPDCIYCDKSKTLLKGLGLSYTESSINDFETKEQFLEAIGKRVKTVPQIKINSVLIGGYNQLVEYFADKGKVNFKGEIINE